PKHHCRIESDEHHETVHSPFNCPRAGLIRRWRCPPPDNIDTPNESEEVVDPDTAAPVDADDFSCLTASRLIRGGMAPVGIKLESEGAVEQESRPANGPDQSSAAMCTAQAQNHANDIARQRNPDGPPNKQFFGIHAHSAIGDPAIVGNPRSRTMGLAVKDR